ncbi:PD-(D/E)XK nuclease family protein, partial [Cerasicoccus arenae]
PPPRPLADLAQAAEFHEKLSPTNPQLKAVITPDITTEACVIESEIHRWRAELGIGERIGVIFARDGLPLAREVSRRLVDCGLAHQDEIGHQPARRTSQNLVEAWRLYQERADADSARAFFRALRRAGHLSSENEDAVRRALEYAFNEAMTTGLDVLRPLLSRQRRGVQAGRILDEWPLLPERGTFAEYTTLCLPVLKKMRWPERLDAWEQRASALAESLTRQIQRGHYLRWLAEVCRIPGRTRADLGREAFAPVVLTTVERASPQSWQYLIFAGLNRGDWPAEQNDSLLLDTRHSARLNLRASMDSPVGLGQKCLRAGKSWLANSLDERRRFSEACASLLSHVQNDALFTAHRENPADPGREQDLADWLNRLIHAQFGRLPGDDDLREAAEMSAEMFAPEPVRHDTFPELTLAWSRRRDPRTPFDQYSFCFAEPPAEPLTLSCRAWEDALRMPAHAWQRHVLRVQPEKELQEQQPRAQATGNWAHSWVQLTGGGEDFLLCPNHEEWTLQVERQAKQVRQRVADAFAQANRGLPDWWRIDWALARRWAHQLADALTQLNWPAIRGEWSLPKQPLHLPGNPLDGLIFSGRIDALLSDTPPEKLSGRAKSVWPDYAAAWIIDFKTGGDKPLSAKQLIKGEGVQLALYALALHSLGAERVQTSLLRPGEEINAQVSLEQMLSLDEPWTRIRNMATTGKLGIRGPQRSDYSFVGEYPLAHLSIKPAILESKWQLTHAAGEDQVTP